jgi:hypothetical protein
MVYICLYSEIFSLVYVEAGLRETPPSEGLKASVNKIEKHEKRNALGRSGLFLSLKLKLKFCFHVKVGRTAPSLFKFIVNRCLRILAKRIAVNTGVFTNRI